MMPVLLNRVREYRWELWLFIGVPLVATIAGSLASVPVALYLSDSYIWPNLTSSITRFALLAISYRWVRRLERTILRLLWQYLLVVAVLSIAFNVIREELYESFSQESATTLMPYIWLSVLGQIVAGLAILAWFARRASGDGFHKALVLIGVVAFSGINFSNVVFYGSWSSAGLVIAQLVLSLAIIPLTLVPIWALKRVDSGTPIPRKVIFILFTAAWLSWLLQYPAFIGLSWWSWLGATVITSTLQIVLYAILIGVAYLIRVRLPKEEPPPEGPVDPSTLLYGRHWSDS